jgi:ribosomal protein S18 acetylase RimI-like enzyme
MAERPSQVPNTEEDAPSSDASELRSSIESAGVENLVLNDLTADDLGEIEWSGSKTHIAYVRRALERVPSGDIEYIAIRSPDGRPVAKGGIDYTKHPDGGEIWQVASHPALERLGLATRLITAAEDRIRRRGFRHAYLGVEDDNAGARRLYKRLDYHDFGREKDAWDQEDDRGHVYRYETEIAIMRKDLRAAADTDSRPQER